MSTPRVMVGVSGGVDSSVAAWRLVQQGEPVAGLFMQNWADDGSGDCRAEDDRRDAVAVCGLLGIPFHFRDFSSEYWQASSRTSWPNTPPAAPPIRTCCATGK